MTVTRPHLLRRSAQIAAFLTCCVLLIPFIGMQLTDDWRWSAADFVFAAVLVFGTGLVCSLLALRSDRPAYRTALAIAMFAGFVLLWANLAVGIVGEPDDPRNLLYYGVLALGAVIASATRFRADGMALAALAVAVGLGASAAVVVAPGLGQPPGTPTVLVAHALFVTAFALAAALFHKAAARD